MKRVPRRYRSLLFCDTCYNVGSGAFMSLFLLSTVVLKTVLDGTENHLALLAVIFGGGSLLSPVVGYVARRTSMRAMVVWPNYLAALLLLLTCWPHINATFFSIFVGISFFTRVFPRVAEMNMYRALYPPTHRGAAVGWVKAVAAITGLMVTLLGYWWFDFQTDLFWMLYVLVAVLLALGSYSYSWIPVSGHHLFSVAEQQAPHRAVWQGLRVILTDRRFVLYQLGFFLSGTANHMSVVFVPEVLKEHIHASDAVIGLAGAVLPAVLLTASSPLWGRFLDRTNPMFGRAIFNSLHAVAFAFHAYGGYIGEAWPFLIGVTIHSISKGGGVINWLTGSMYFARKEHVALYNAVHVWLTGLRGLLAPLLGLYVYSSHGMNLGYGVFTVAAVLATLGALVMFVQGLTAPGSREEMPATSQRGVELG